MTVPDFQSLMLPLLSFIMDGKKYSTDDITKSLKQHFRLSDEDLNELLPSGTQTKFINRLHWARIYLKHAILLTFPERGLTQITPRGLQLLESKPTIINKKMLMNYEEFVEFQKRSKKETNEGIEGDENDSLRKTPEELIEENFLHLRNNLELDLLDIIKKCSPRYLNLLS